MAVVLQKGANVSLSKEAPGLKAIAVGLAWDARSTSGAAFDLDASAFLLGADGKVLSQEYFVFYNNLKSPDGSVEHTGDNLTGAGEGEVIKVNLEKIPANVQKVVFTVTIYDAEARGQNFGQVSNASIRVLNQADNQELTRYDLAEDFSVETAMIFGELYRYQNDWKFRAVGQGFAGGLMAMVKNYGLG